MENKTEETKLRFRSDCCGVEAKWQVDPYSTYTQACREGKAFICQRCLRPCKLTEMLIKNAMQKIAKRKPGRRKLVYDKATKKIVIVSKDSKEVIDSGLKIHEL